MISRKKLLSTFFREKFVRSSIPRVKCSLSMISREKFFRKFLRYSIPPRSRKKNQKKKNPQRSKSVHRPIPGRNLFVCTLRASSGARSDLAKRFSRVSRTVHVCGSRVYSIDTRTASTRWKVAEFLNDFVILEISTRQVTARRIVSRLEIPSRRETLEVYAEFSERIAERAVFDEAISRNGSAPRSPIGAKPRECFSPREKP